MMNFYDAMSESLLTRLEQIEPGFTRTPAYREADKGLSSELEAMNAGTADRLRGSIVRMFDLYSRFFYSAGFQDGMKVQQDDFSFKMIE